MTAKPFRPDRSWKAFTRSMRELRLIAHGALSPRRPIMGNIIPIRRCNLACAYCNEYDDFSQPVPTDVVIHRINKLADLGTSIVTLPGGEPLLHPDLDNIIAAMRGRGVMACMITNGYLLMPDRIERLNRAGLDHMQISIDNVMPDEVSKKSLKVLDKKLQMLAEYAEFHVNINSVVGGGIHNPDDALVVGRPAIELGFSATVGIIHDGDGQLRPPGDRDLRKAACEDSVGEVEVMCAGLFAFSCAAAALLAARSELTQVSGDVLDNEGAVIADAEVRLISTEPPFEVSRTRTNRNGSFR